MHDCDDLLKVLIRNLKGFQCHVKMCTIKTLTNAWATSYRYHEGILLPCIFGCSKSMFGCLNFDTLRAHESPFDTVAHYIRCPILNYIVCKALGKFTRISPEQWLGVGCKPPSSPITTCVAFTVYHGIKLSHISSVREAIENGKELDPSVSPLPLVSALA